MLFVLMAFIIINRHNTVKILPFNFLLELERYLSCKNIECRASFKWRMHLSRHLKNCPHEKPTNRHFSHVTKSRILKNLNLRKKTYRNFRRTFLKNCFRHLKLYSNPPCWLARGRCHMGTFWKTKDWSSHFWEGQLSAFGTWDFTAKEDLNRWKQVFLLNFRPWPAQKLKIWSIFYGK